MYLSGDRDWAMVSLMDDTLTKKLRERMRYTAKGLPNPHLRGWSRFITLWPHIKEELDCGYTILDVHRALVTSKVWSSGYDVFRRHVARARQADEEPDPQGLVVADADAEDALLKKVRRRLQKTARPRVAFHSVRPSVERLVAEGYSKKSIYLALKAEGAIDCAYTTWCRMVAASVEQPSDAGTEN